jgi:hypothetical protein
MKSAIAGWDNTFYYAWLRSAFMERPFDFRQTIESTRTLPDPIRLFILQLPTTPTGKVANKYGIGWAVAGAPFFLAADAVVRTVNATGLGPVARDGYGPLYQLALLIGQLAYAVASLFLAWRIVRRWVPDPVAMEGVLLCWLGSFLMVYQTWLLSMAHNVTFFAIVWAYWAGLRVGEKRTGWGIWLQLGLACGLAVVTRYQTAVYLVFPAWVAGQALVRGDSGARSGWGLAMLAGGVLVFLQMLGWKLVYGEWFLYTYQGERFDWSAPHLGRVLFSPFHGLFYWSPVLLAGCVGYFLWLKSHAAAGWSWTVALLATLWVNSSWEYWWLGASYGSRTFEGCVLFFMIGTAWLLHITARFPGWQRALRTGLGLLAVANMVLSHQALFGKISLEKPITHRQMVESLGR